MVPRLPCTAGGTSRGWGTVELRGEESRSWRGRRLRRVHSKRAKPEGACVMRARACFETMVEGAGRANGLRAWLAG